jgi:hypothetical protein
MKVRASTRVVFVLGRRTRLTASAIEAASTAASSVTVLSIGYPVTRAQRRAVDAALGLAVRLGVTVDALLVPSAAELPTLAGDDDRVVVTGSRRERRRLEHLIARG